MPATSFKITNGVYSAEPWCHSEIDTHTMIIKCGPEPPLTPVRIDRPDVITAVGEPTFTVHGRIDLLTYPEFVSTGTVRMFVDRSEVAVPATLDPDGTFHSGPITVNDNQSWYRDRHYIAVNFYDGINLNTMVYQVAVTPPPT